MKFYILIFILSNSLSLLSGEPVTTPRGEGPIQTVARLTMKELRRIDSANVSYEDKKNALEDFIFEARRNVDNIKLFREATLKLRELENSQTRKTAKTP